MRLNAFRIRNFKSIIDTGECKISEIDNVVILAGQNESGKTSVLEALDFFANGPSEKFIKFQKRQGTNETEIVCSFLFGEFDMKFLEEEFINIIEIQEFLKRKKSVTFTRKFAAGKDNGICINPEFFNNFPEFFTLANQSQDVEESEEGDDEDEEDQEAQASSQNGTTAPNLRDNYIEQIANKIEEILPTFSLYSSFKDLLPSEITVAELQNSKAVQDFENVFDVKLKSLADIIDARERKIQIKEIQTSNG